MALQRISIIALAICSHLLFFLATTAAQGANSTPAPIGWPTSPSSGPPLVNCPQGLSLARPGSSATTIICTIDNVFSQLPMVWNIGGQSINVTSGASATGDGIARSYSVSTGYGRLAVTLVIPNDGSTGVKSYQLSVNGITLGNVKLASGFEITSGQAAVLPGGLLLVASALLVC